MNKISFESIFQSLCQKLEATNNLGIISSSFSQQSSDRERIHYLLQLDAVQRYLCLPDDCEAIVGASRKSPEVSVKFRNKGNEYFKAKNYMMALCKYTESLSYAPLLEKDSDVGDSVASLAFANRSAVLFQLEKHELCLGDICLSFTMNYPPALAYKLHDRKGQCELALGYRKEAFLSFHAAVDALAVSDLEDSRRQKWHMDLNKRMQSCEVEHGSDHVSRSVELPSICQDIPEIYEHQRNSQFESLSDACDVAYDPLVGRHIVAKRDILPGDVILSEKPYAAVMLADSRLDHCSHCYKFTLAPIPCLYCCLSLYCSVECRSLAFQLYHRVECRLGEILEKSGIDTVASLAIRTLMVTPLDVIYKHCGPFLPCELSHNINSTHCDIGNDEIYKADSYEAICGLVTHDKSRTGHELFQRATIAIFLLRCLCFAGYFETENPPADVLSGAGGLLLRHLQSFTCNVHEIEEFHLNPGAVTTSSSHVVGSGIYATLSLFNHSCDPAVTRNFYGDRCVVRAIRSVRTGEEVSDDYGAMFAMHPRSERHAYLLPQFFFDCKCRACIEDWPLLSTLMKTDFKWRCCRCFTAFPTDSMKCIHCTYEMNLSEYFDRLNKSDITYKDAFNKLLKCHINEALPAFLSHLRVMDELLCPPCATYVLCQEAVKRCFSIMANCRCNKLE